MILVCPKRRQQPADGDASGDKGQSELTWARLTYEVDFNYVSLTCKRCVFCARPLRIGGDPYGVVMTLSQCGRQKLLVRRPRGCGQAARCGEKETSRQLGRPPASITGNEDNRVMLTPGGRFQRAARISLNEHIPSSGDLVVVPIIFWHSL